MTLNIVEAISQEWEMKKLFQTFGFEIVNSLPAGTKVFAGSSSHHAGETSGWWQKATTGRWALLVEGSHEDLFHSSRTEDDPAPWRQQDVACHGFTDEPWNKDVLLSGCQGGLVEEERMELLPAWLPEFIEFFAFLVTPEEHKILRQEVGKIIPLEKEWYDDTPREYCLSMALEAAIEVASEKAVGALLGAAIANAACETFPGMSHKGAFEIARIAISKEGVDLFLSHWGDEV